MGTRQKIGQWGRKISPLPVVFMHRLRPGRVINTLTVLAIFAGITFFASSPSPRLDRYMALTYGIVAALGVQITRRSIPAGLFLVWTAFIFWVHPMTPILAVLAAVLYAGGILFLSRSAVPARWIYNFICCYTIWNVFWQLLQILGLATQYGGFFTAASSLSPTIFPGLQTNIGETSALYAVCLPAFFRRRWAWLLPVPLAGLVFVRESVGITAAAIAGVAYFIMGIPGQKKLLATVSAILILVCGIGYAAFIDPFSFESFKQSRLQTWKESVFIAMQKPWFGWGYGQFHAVVPLLSTPTQLLVDDRKRLYNEVEDKRALLATAYKITGTTSPEGVAAYYTNKKYPQSFYFEAHNEYVEALFAAGIPALLLLVWAMIDAVRLSGFFRFGKKPSPESLGIIASCAGAMVWFVWQTVPIAVVTVAWAGLCMAKQEEI